MEHRCDFWRRRDHGACGAAGRVVRPARLHGRRPLPWKPDSQQNNAALVDPGFAADPRRTPLSRPLPALVHRGWVAVAAALLVCYTEACLSRSSRHPAVVPSVGPAVVRSPGVSCGSANVRRTRLATAKRPTGFISSAARASGPKQRSKPWPLARAYLPMQWSFARSPQSARRTHDLRGSPEPTGRRRHVPDAAIAASKSSTEVSESPSTSGKRGDSVAPVTCILPARPSILEPSTTFRLGSRVVLPRSIHPSWPS